MTLPACGRCWRALEALPFTRCVTGHDLPEEKASLLARASCRTPPPGALTSPFSKETDRLFVRLAGLTGGTLFFYDAKSPSPTPVGGERGFFLQRTQAMVGRLFLRKTQVRPGTSSDPMAEAPMARARPVPPVRPP